MKRHASLVLLVLFAVVPLMAQQAPEGWMMRVDKSTSASDPDAAGTIKFMTMGSTLHAVNPQAAVYWNPTNTMAGNYSVKGTFTLVKPSGHTNYYGLVFGGKDLGGAGQNYLSFLVGQNGTWLVKQRNTDKMTEDVAAKMANAAVKQPDASGKSVNALEVSVMGDKLQFKVNGTTVHTMAKGSLTTDGIYGIRVNHQLEVLIDDFAASKM